MADGRFSTFTVDMEQTEDITRWVIPARDGRAIRMRRGATFRLIDLDGGQVGDLFAFSATDSLEYLSASHTRTSTGRLFPHTGEQFVTNRRRPILGLVSDTSPGVHDMLIAACDDARYSMLGVTEHASCADNLHGALGRLDLTVVHVPQPVNVFMNVPATSDGDLRWLPAPSRPGDAVTFEAAMDCVVVVSACPMDLNSINGERPSPLAIELLTPNHPDYEEV